MHAFRSSHVTLAIVAAAAFAGTAGAVENISQFTFNANPFGPALTIDDFTGRVVGVFSPCQT